MNQQTKDFATAFLGSVGEAFFSLGARRLFQGHKHSDRPWVAAWGHDWRKPAVVGVTEYSVPGLVRLSVNLLDELPSRFRSGSGGSRCQEWSAELTITMPELVTPLLSLSVAASALGLDSVLPSIFPLDRRLVDGREYLRGYEFSRTAKVMFDAESARRKANSRCRLVEMNQPVFPVLEPESSSSISPVELECIAVREDALRKFWTMHRARMIVLGKAAEVTCG